ncbi:MAG: glycosyltransferase family 39 protein [Thermoproteota archaeon]
MIENNVKIGLRLTKKDVFLLISVITTGLLVRFYYFPYDIPITLDAFSYFLYAMDTMVSGQLPTKYTMPNNGWPLFLSIFFSIFRFENFLDYVTLQRVLTVIFSVLTAIPTYLLCKKFFNQNLAFLGALLVVLTPRIVQNSLGGTTDPFYIFLTTTAVFLFLSKKKIWIYTSFFILALSSLVRYEGLLLLIPFSILFIVRFKAESKIVLRYLMVLGIFTITLLPVAYLRIEATGQDGLLSHVFGGARVAVTEGSFLKESDTKFVFQDGIFGLIKYVSVVLFPLFFIFIPYGLYIFFKKRGYEINSLIFIAIFMLIPGFYAYGRGIQEPRYVLVVLPIASVISLYTIEKFLSKTSLTKFILILMLVFIVSSSLAYLEFKKTDYSHEREAVQLSLIIQTLKGGINEFSPESTYVHTATFHDVKMPLLTSAIDFEPKIIALDGQTVEEGIMNGRKDGLSYLIVDNLNTKQNRKPFLNDVFYQEENYPYLIKIFDSKEHGYNYQVKIFKIDYDKFDSIIQR